MRRGILKSTRTRRRYTLRRTRSCQRPQARDPTTTAPALHSSTVGTTSQSSPHRYSKAKDEGGRMKDEGEASTAPPSSFILPPSSLSLLASRAEVGRAACVCDTLD